MRFHGLKLLSVVLLLSLTFTNNLFAFTSAPAMFLPASQLQEPTPVFQIPSNPKDKDLMGYAILTIAGGNIPNPTTVIERAFSNVSDRLLDSLVNSRLGSIFKSIGIDSELASLFSSFTTRIINQGFLQPAWAWDNSEALPVAIPIRPSSDGTQPEIHIPGPTDDPSAFDAFRQFLIRNGPAFLIIGGIAYKIFSNANGSGEGSGGGSISIEKVITELLLINGVEFGYLPEGVSPPYFDRNNPNSFVGSLEGQGVSKDAVQTLALFETGGLSADIYNWLSDISGGNKLTKEIMKKLNAIFSRQTTPFVPLGYSGAGQPLLKAINQGLYNIETAVLVGVPSYPLAITNPYLERIVNVYGQNDLGRQENQNLLRAFLNPFLGSSPLSYSLPFIQKNYPGVQTINIELKGIDHQGYFVKPGERSTASPLKLKAERFMAELAAQSRAEKGLQDFLAKLGDLKDGQYFVDLNEFYSDEVS